MAKKLEEERHVRALNPKHIDPAVSKRTVWCVEAPHGTLPKDLLEPSYWKHVVNSKKLVGLDLLDASCEDGTWYAQYLILRVGDHYAKLQLLNEYSMVDASVIADTVLYTKWVAPTVKWGVLRVSDNEILRSGFDRQIDAAEWMNLELRNMAA